MKRLGFTGKNWYFQLYCKAYETHHFCWDISNERIIEHGFQLWIRKNRRSEKCEIKCVQRRNYYEQVCFCLRINFFFIFVCVAPQICGSCWEVRIVDMLPVEDNQYMLRTTFLLNYTVLKPTLIQYPVLHIQPAIRTTAESKIPFLRWGIFRSK